MRNIVFTAAAFFFVFIGHPVSSWVMAAPPGGTNLPAERDAVEKVHNPYTRPDDRGYHPPYPAPRRYYGPAAPYYPRSAYGHPIWPTDRWEPVRPANCGVYRYWNGEYCADARDEPPYIGPRR